MKLSVALSSVIPILILGTALAMDWSDSWDTADPHILGDGNPTTDPRTTRRGSSGVIEINQPGDEGVAKFFGKPRLYIDDGSDDAGWMNVEFTGYAKFVNDGDAPSSFSGFTMATRSSHDTFSHDGCDAMGYYFQIRRNDGKCRFLKEYYHDGAGSIYSNAVTTPCMDRFANPDELPIDFWIGMKFMVMTPPGSEKVYLKLYMDYSPDQSQAWELVHEFVDRPGAMPEVSTRDIPDSCPQSNGDVNLRRGNISFLRSDGSLTTEVHWKDASVVSLDAVQEEFCATGRMEQGDVCCDLDASTCDVPTLLATTDGTADCIDAFSTNCRRPSSWPPVTTTLPTTTTTTPMYTGPFCTTGIPLNRACCAASCGTCGGGGCGTRSGGSANCCYGAVLAQEECTSATHEGCLIPDIATTTTTTATTPTTTTTVGVGGDPHFQRWGQSRRDSFHGECDLVLLHSDNFHDGAGLDVHIRTTIDTYYSYVESAALRVGPHLVQVEPSGVTVNHEKHLFQDLPIAFGTGQDAYTVTMLEHSRNVKKLRLDLRKGDYIDFKFYKHYLTLEISGHVLHFADSVGMLGEFGTGNMYNRHGQLASDFAEHALAWQVQPGDDVQLFLHERSPQFPYERCRMPTAARPARRLLRSAGTEELWGQAEVACGARHVGHDFELCLEDVMTTGDLGLAEAW